jgi:hypothetical protein
VRAHSLRAIFCHLRVLSFQTVKDFCGGLRPSATATLIDLATQAVDYGLTALLIFFQEPQPVTNDLAGRRVTPTIHLFFDEDLEVMTDCVA